MFFRSVRFVRLVVALAPFGVAGAWDRKSPVMTALLSGIGIVEVGAILRAPDAGRTSGNLGAGVVERFAEYPGLPAKRLDQELPFFFVTAALRRQPKKVAWM